MCLSIPAEIISIKDDKAKVSVGGNIYNANIELVDDVKIGEFVLLHSGYAISKIDEVEARNTLTLMQEIKKRELSNL